MTEEEQRQAFQAGMDFFNYGRPHEYFYDVQAAYMTKPERQAFQDGYDLARAEYYAKQKAEKPRLSRSVDSGPPWSFYILVAFIVIIGIHWITHGGKLL